MKKRNFLAMVTAIGLGTTALGTGSLMAQDLTPISFRLDWTIYGSHAPFYLAVQEGLYEAEGLDVSIGEGQGSPTVAQFVAQGNDQFGFVDFGSMVRGVEQGLPLKAVMRVISDVATIISHSDAPVETPSDLTDKVVAFAPGESSAQLFDALLEAEGVDPASVGVLNPAVGAKNAMLLQRRADAIPGYYNVQVAQLEAQGADVEYFLFSDYGLSLMNNGIVTSDAFIADNPEAVEGFLAATVRGWEMAQEDPEAAIDALIAALPEQERNREALARQLELTFPSLVTANTEDEPFGYMAQADWEEMQTLLATYAGMERELPVEQYYTNDFLPE
ncbi:ABC transporter substrate-binding protein [Pelagibacterium montanilacus]|uniref:ABC transporter substrate-binding protein n=1 Tax=Pelagibacterium montanilacus TaxID=2185280 RepID=UPI000F8EE479|nr:ABC transporter substrate-binding protein [Pelagibacterium montanilacus]